MGRWGYSSEGNTVEARTFLLQSAFHITATDKSSTLFTGLRALQHRASLLTHTLTFLLLDVPVMLSIQPLYLGVLLHISTTLLFSEIIQAEFFFPPIPFSSFLKSSLPPHQLWFCNLFLPLLAQTPQMLSLSLLNHPRIYLSLQLLLQNSLSLFRFSLASYKFLLSISSHFNAGHCPPLSQRFCCHRGDCSQIVQLSLVLSYHHHQPLYLLGSDQNCVQQNMSELSVANNSCRQKHKNWASVQWCFACASSRPQWCTALRLCQSGWCL